MQGPPGREVTAGMSSDCTTRPMVRDVFHSCSLVSAHDSTIENRDHDLMNTSAQSSPAVKRFCGPDQEHLRPVKQSRQRDDSHPSRSAVRSEGIFSNQGSSLMEVQACLRRMEQS